MNKKYLLPLFMLCFGKIASAQISDKIEKAQKDPATQERSAKADVLRMDKTAIIPGKDSNATQQQVFTREKGRTCKKKGSSKP